MHLTPNCHVLMHFICIKYVYYVGLVIYTLKVIFFRNAHPNKICEVSEDPQEVFKIDVAYIFIAF